MLNKTKYTGIACVLSWSKPTMQGMLLELKLNRDGSMTVKKDITQLNYVFQIGNITRGKEEKVVFKK